MMTKSIPFNETKIIQDYGRSSLELLKQISYWTNHAETSKKIIGIMKDGKRWLYNTNKTWAKQIGYSERQIERAVSNLSTDGLLLKEKHSRYGKAPINMLTINTEKIAELGLYATPKTMDSPRSVKHINSSQSPTLSENIKGNTGSLDHKGMQTQNNTTVQDMLAVWNTQFPQNQAVITKEYGKFLYAAFTRSFNQEIKQWEDYCSFLSKSHPNRISLDTALKFYTINSYKNKPVQSPSKASSPVFTGSITSEQPTSFTLSDSYVDTTQSQEMLDIWNRIFGEKKSMTTMTPSLAILLAESLKENFESNLDVWRSYCLTMESSPYIMSNEFILRIKTALTKNFIDKISAKELKIQKTHIPQKRYDNEVESHISKMKIEEKDYPVLHEARKFFVKRYGAPAYKSWIMQVDLKITNGELIILGTEFRRDWIKKDYGEIFKYVKLNAPTSQNQTIPLQNSSQESNNIKEDILQNKNLIEEHSNQEDIDHTIKKELAYDESDLFIEENSNNYPLVSSSNQDIIHWTPIEEGRGRDTPDRPIYHKYFSMPLKTPSPTNTVDTKSTIILENPQPDDTNKPSLENNTNEIGYIYIDVQDLPKVLITENPQMEVEQPRHNSSQNVGDGGGQHRHEGGDYIRTKLLNQHNNNLIRGTRLCNNPSKSNESSSQQVRNYYLKICYLKNEVKTKISEIKYTKKIFCLNKKCIGMQRKSFYHSMQMTLEKGIQPLKTNLVGKWRAEKSSNTKNLTIMKERFCNSPFDKLENSAPKIDYSTIDYKIFRQNNIFHSGESCPHVLLKDQEHSKKRFKSIRQSLDEYLSIDISSCIDINVWGFRNYLKNIIDFRAGYRRVEDKKSFESLLRCIPNNVVQKNNPFHHMEVLQTNPWIKEQHDELSYINGKNTYVSNQTIYF